jgi:hypothetical protein
MRTCLPTVPTPLLAWGEPFLDWIPTEFLFHLAVVTGAGFLLWIGVNWVERLRLRYYVNAQTPKALFRELCRAHGFSRADRNLLKLIADEAAPELRCRVFIDSQVIERFAVAHPDEADGCRFLARRLFSEGSKPPR